MKKLRNIQFATIIFAWMISSGCNDVQTASNAQQPAANTAIVPAASLSENKTIRFLEERVKRDPEDFIAHNKLTSAYLQRLRETGDAAYLDLALRAANASLAALPAEQNKGGLAALIQGKFSSHEFAEVLDLARKLIALEPNKGYPYQFLGDALMELGQYDEAEAAFRQMSALGGTQAMTNVAIEQRLARMAILYGDRAKATAHMTNALRFAEMPPGTSAETVAWCKWQLGEMAFAEGNFKIAEAHFNSALKTFPGYFAAVEALGHLRAANGDLEGAIDSYERSAPAIPDPASAAMLGDLYKLVGRDEDAARQYALFDEIERLDAAKGNIHSRELAMFYANHDIKTDQACDSAAREYETRKDIWGADLVAWACYKAGRTDEAKAAMRDALRLGTKDAQLFYHAGMIERGLGNQNEARRLLNLALKTNPAFDLLQAEKARSILAAMN